MDLVIDHVLQTLVISRPQEDLGVELATREAIVHYFIASVLVAVLLQQKGYFTYVHSIIERGGVTNLTLICTDLALCKITEKNKLIVYLSFTNSIETSIFCTELILRTDI